VWSINNGGGWLSQTFSTSQTSTSSNQLKLAISPCTGSCTGFNFSAGGITTTSSLYGYGIYTAEIKAPVSPGFTAQLEVPSPHLFRFLSFSLSLSPTLNWAHYDSERTTPPDQQQVHAQG
jgi:hypothetical protein